MDDAEVASGSGSAGKNPEPEVIPDDMEVMPSDSKIQNSEPNVNGHEVDSLDGATHDSLPESPPDPESLPDPEAPTDVIVLDSGSDDEVYTNPEPPVELLSGELINAGNIGDTVYSKHWLFTTLMNLIKAVDGEENSKDSGSEERDRDQGLDLEEALQDELCKLWDMSMNAEVVNFLMDFKAIDIFTGVIAKSKAPRAIEIGVGILGNMACTEVACKAISVNDKLRTLILVLLESPDAPTLVETTRLLYTCMSSAAVYDLWMTSVRDTPTVHKSLVFILESSTNPDLLSHTADLIDKVMDTEDDLLIHWSQPNLVRGILEAIKQCRTNKETLDTFLHILQLITTCDDGVEAIGSESTAICDLALQYILQLCDEDLLVLDGSENALGCVLCVLTTAFTALDDKAKLVATDFQLMRCLLKILHNIYPKVRQFTPEAHRQYSRSESCSERRPRSRNSSTCEKNSETSETHLSRTSSKDDSEKGDGDSESKSVEKTEDDADCSKKDKQSEGESEKGSKDSPDTATYDMLYEVLQNLLTDVILVLTEQSEDSPVDESEASPSTSQSEAVEKSHDQHSKTLTYLSEHCERPRLRILVYTLDEVFQDTEMDCCGRLKQTAQKYKFARLERIIEEYSAG